MKKDWTYKKLGEVCEIICGQDYKTVQDDNGAYPIYGTGGIMGYASQYRCPSNSVIIGRKGNINNPLFVEQPFWNVDTAFGVVPKTTHLIPKYFFYFCKGYDFTKHDVSVTIPSLRRTDILKIQVPVPSLETQSQIVSELDLLQSIIDKQKAQLKELDNLAQAVFYDMFGDPVENEKGWEVKKIGDIGNVERGAGISKKDFVETGLPCIHYGQLHTCLGPITHVHKTCIPHNLLPKYKIAHPGDVVMAITSEDVEGSCKSTAWLGNYDIVVGSDAAIFHHNINGVYISYYTQTKAYYNEKAKYAKGFKVTHISTTEIESITIPVPPLSLQQSFAAKIESIEKQKAAINKSIAESQKLFDYTMDKYFG